MSDEDKTIPTWGYGKKGAQIFDLKEGESLPKGYYDSPVAMEEAETNPAKTEKSAPDAD
jgi:hypothetical protein